MKRVLTTLAVAAAACAAVPATAPAKAAPQGAGEQPGGRLEPLPARPAGDARRPARHRPPDVRAGDHARGDRRRGRLDRPQRQAVSRDHVRALRRRAGSGRRRRRARHAGEALSDLQPQIDQQYGTELASVPGGPLRRLAGIAVGQQVARQVLRSRAGDGSDAAPLPFTPGTNPGDYQLTPPAFAQPQFTHWGNVRAVRAAQAVAVPPAGAARAEQPQDRRRARRGPDAWAPRPAPPAPPTRRRSACSGTRRSGPPGTASRRPRRSATTRACPTRRAASPRSTSASPTR